MYISLSVCRQGTSHQQNNIPCQDYALHQVLSDGTAVGIIADGIGSSPVSQDGSMRAAQEAMDTILSQIEGRPHSSTDHLAIIQKAFVNSRNRLISTAKENNSEIAAYETTLTIIILSGDTVSCGHCGDGGVIALDRNGSLFSITEQHSGQYAGQVYTLASHPKHWTFGQANMHCAGVIMATDGMLDFFEQIDTKERSQYLSGYLSLCYKSSNANKLALQKALSHHISSSEILERVDDDRTVLLICDTDFSCDTQTMWQNPINIADRCYDPSLESQHHSKSPSDTKAKKKAPVRFAVAVTFILLAIIAFVFILFLNNDDRISAKQPSSDTDSSTAVTASDSDVSSGDTI